MIWIRKYSTTNTYQDMYNSDLFPASGITSKSKYPLTTHAHFLIKHSSCLIYGQWMNLILKRRQRNAPTTRKLWQSIEWHCTFTTAPSPVCIARLFVHISVHTLRSLFRSLRHKHSIYRGQRSRIIISLWKVMVAGYHSINGHADYVISKIMVHCKAK